MKTAPPSAVAPFRNSGMVTVLVLGLGFAGPGCWFGHDYSNCQDDNNCSSVQVCDDGLCRLRAGVQACGGDNPACPAGFVCDLSLAACVADAGGDIGGGDAGDDDAADVTEDPDVGSDSSGNDTSDGSDTNDDNDTDVPDLGEDLFDANVDPPEVPTGVIASAGTSPNFVNVSWTASARATSYRIYRDDVEIARTVSATSYDDETALASLPTATELTPSASQGTQVGFVRLSWSVPQTLVGPTHQYSVEAENVGGLSGRSATDPGYRAAAAVLSYQIRQDGADWADVGNVLSFDEYDVDQGSITSAGTTTASVQTSYFLVSLGLESVETDPGSTASFEVRAVNQAGSGEISNAVSGYANAAVAYEWQRSHSRFGYEYESIGAPSSGSVEDVDGPIGETERWYRCGLSTSTSPEPLFSAPSSGSRKVGTLNLLLPTVWSLASATDWMFVAHDNADPGARLEAFRWSGLDWEFIQYITPPGGVSDSGFATAIAACDDLLVVGARRQHTDEPAEDTEVFHVYRNTTPDEWTLEDSLFGLEPNLPGRLDCDAGRVAGVSKSGSYLYLLQYSIDGSDWEIDQTSFDVGSGDLVIHGDRVFAGDQGSSITLSDAGAIAVFDILDGISFAGWIEQETPVQDNRFGTSFAFVDDYLVASSREVIDDHVVNSIFQEIAGEWTELGQLRTPHLGSSVPVAPLLRSDSNLLFIADHDDADGAGRLWAYELIAGEFQPLGDFSDDSSEEFAQFISVSDGFLHITAGLSDARTIQTLWVLGAARQDSEHDYFSVLFFSEEPHKGLDYTIAYGDLEGELLACDTEHLDTCPAETDLDSCYLNDADARQIFGRTSRSFTCNPDDGGRFGRVVECTVRVAEEQIPSEDDFQGVATSGTTESCAAFTDLPAIIVEQIDVLQEW